MVIKVKDCRFLCKSENTKNKPFSFHKGNNLKKQKNKRKIYVKVYSLRFSKNDKIYNRHSKYCKHV